MFNNISNGGGSKEPSPVGRTLVLIAVLVVVTQAVAASSIDFDNYSPEHSDDFSSFDTSVWTLDGSGAQYESTNEQVQITDGTDNGVLNYDAGTPTTDWILQYNATSNGDYTGTIVQIHTSSATAAKPSDGYELVFRSNKDTVTLYNRSSGTTLKQTSHTIGASPEITTEYRNGTIHAHINGNHAFNYTISDVAKSGDTVAVRAWSGANNAKWHITDATVYRVPQDSDGDGIYDANDPYPSNAPESYLINVTENETVESAYVETSNGTFDLSVYGINETSGEQILLTESSHSVGSETTLVTRDVPSGYDKYKLSYHGNATLESHGLIYSANSGGGVSEDTFWSGIGIVTQNQGALQTQNILLGLLIVGIGFLLWFTEVTH